MVKQIQKQFLVVLSQVPEFKVGEVFPASKFSWYAKRNGHVYQRNPAMSSCLAVLKGGSLKKIIEAREC